MLEQACDTGVKDGMPTEHGADTIICRIESAIGEHQGQRVDMKRPSKLLLGWRDWNALERWMQDHNATFGHIGYGGIGSTPQLGDSADTRCTYKGAAIYKVDEEHYIGTAS